jgi:two-component system, response regulator
METIIDVLVVDDSDPHARTTLSGVRYASETAKVLRLKDGAQALQYIYREGSFKDRPNTLPRMILLELDLPTLNGLQVLDRLHNDPQTRNIPVIVLTRSGSSIPVNEADAHGASACLIKPEDKGEYIYEVAGLVRRWLGMAGAAPK